MNEPRVYKNSSATFIVIVLFFLILVGFVSFGLNSNSILDMTPFIIIALVIFTAIFVVNSSRVVISEDEITVRNLLGSKTLRWTEIGRAYGRGYGIKLRSRDEDVTLAPSSQLSGYEEIVETIGRKRPDLFSPREYGEMRRGLSSYLGALLLVLFLAGITAGFLIEFNFTPEALAFFGVFAFIILVLLSTFLASPQSVILDGRTLQLKYLMSEKTLSADDITSVQLAFTRTRNGKQYYIVLYLSNRKNVRISGLGVSLPVAYLVLKNWQKENSQSTFR